MQLALYMLSIISIDLANDENCLLIFIEFGDDRVGEIDIC
jgi:hypothetical protein